jgi:ribosomally synthesized peptide (two-chain TOMM family)
MSWFVKVNNGAGNGQPAVAAMVEGDQADVTSKTGGDYVPGALESTMHWQVIWPRVVAKAWRDQEFHAALLADPKQAILGTFGYKLIDELNFTVKDAPADAKFDVEKAYNVSTESPQDPWSRLPHMELTMYLPPAPPADLQAVAITAYQDTGRTYPFTCC